MGESAAETVREISEVRDRLDGEFRELEQRLPQAAVWLKRAAGTAVAGGAGSSALWFVVRRIRRRRAAARHAEQMTAAVPVIEVLPEEWTDALAEVLRDGRWKPYAALGVGLWVLFRLAEGRRLRRMVLTASASRLTAARHPQ